MKVKLPTWAGGTRWVGHILSALDHILDRYPAFRLHLKQLAASKEKSDGKSKALGFLKLLWSWDVIAMSLFLQDVLTILHKVSLKFQQEGSIVAEVSLSIKTAMKAIKWLKDTDGPYLKKLPQYETLSAPSAGATTRQMYNLTTGTGLLVEERKGLVNALYAALQNHFDDSNVVKATAIADFKMWPTNDDDLSSFGDTWMNTLLQQFGTYLDDADQVRAE